MPVAPPKVLYKYRHFNARSIESLCVDTVHFADPSTFNDPLDCRPNVEADCTNNELAKTVF